MSNCYLCDYYDSSVNACNADDICYADGYEKGRADAINAFINAFNYLLNCGMGKKKALEHLTKMGEKMKGENA